MRRRKKANPLNLMNRDWKSEERPRRKRGTREQRTRRLSPGRGRRWKEEEETNDGGEKAGKTEINSLMRGAREGREAVVLSAK